MQKLFLKIGVLAFGLFTLTYVTAQTKPKPKPAAAKPAAKPSTSGYGGGASKPSTSGYGAGAKTKPTTTKPGAKPTTGGAAASGYGAAPADNNASSGYGAAPANAGGASGYGAPAGNSGPTPRKSGLPYTVVENKGTGSLGDSVKISLRNDNAIEIQSVKDRTPLAYDHIREDDAIYRQRLWLEIDAREKQNQVFGYAADESNGNQRFISILLDAIKSDTTGTITPFSSDDDRFTTPYTKKQVLAKIFGGMDTTEQLDLKGNIIGYEVRAKLINADSIYKFRIKEDVVFDKEASRLVRRIIGIAPIMPRYSSLGTKIGEEILFWLYYPDIRKVLSKYDVYNTRNLGTKMTWDDLMESHMFSYYIIKTSYNNFRNQEMKDYVKDPLFRLLEGEKVKQRIFDYEQGLWAY